MHDLTIWTVWQPLKNHFLQTISQQILCLHELLWVEYGLLILDYYQCSIYVILLSKLSISEVQFKCYLFICFQKKQNKTSYQNEFIGTYQKKMIECLKRSIAHYHSGIFRIPSFQHGLEYWRTAHENELMGSDSLMLRSDDKGHVAELPRFQQMSISFLVRGKCGLPIDASEFLGQILSFILWSGHLKYLFWNRIIWIFYSNDWKFQVRLLIGFASGLLVLV